MFYKFIQWVFLLEILFAGTGLSVPSSTSTDSKVSKLESELESTKKIVYEMLESVNKLSKESLVSNAELEQIRNNINLHESKILNLSKMQEVGGGDKIERRFQSMSETIRDSKDSFSAILEDAMISVDKKIAEMKDDIMKNLEERIKRQKRREFVSEEKLEEVSSQIEELSKLPETLSASVAEVHDNITSNFNKMTISREEFASFRLNVARDSSKTRFDEGHWVVIQQRGQFGSPENFSRSMADYVSGFGDPSKEFWLGLDKIELLTTEGAELRIELETFQGNKLEAAYSSFRVEGEDYRIYIEGYQGNAGDSLKIDNGMAFSARDNDRDQWVGDCSQTRGLGGWWFNGCSLANLNGINFGEHVNNYDGILWYFYAKDNRSFKSSRMMIRKRS